jgi:Family of unknown function (DUF5681)
MTDEAAKQTPRVDATESLADDYRVGPGRPPLETRWKPGNPSPNPKGRPRKNAALTPDVKKLFEDVLNRKVTVTRNGRQTTLAKLEMGFEQLANQFAKGDRHARRDVFTYAAQLGVDFTGKAQALKEALAPNYQEILDAYSRRRRPATERQQDERVLAPADLLDDDAVKGE